MSPETGVRSKSEKLSCLQLVALAPVYIVYQEEETSHLQLQYPELHTAPAVDWGYNFVLHSLGCSPR